MKNLAHVDRRELIENWHLDPVQTLLRALHRLGAPVDCFLDFLFDKALGQYHAVIVFVARSGVDFKFDTDPQGDFIIVW